MFGLVARSAPYLGKAWGWIKGSMGITAGVIGGGIAAEKMTEKTDPAGNVIKPGVVTDVLRSGSNLAGGAVRTIEDHGKAGERKLAAATAVYTAEQAAATAAAQKSAEVDAQAKIFRMQAQEKALHGRIEQANFWTGTFGSIIVDIINAVAPNSTIANWANEKVAQANRDQVNVKSLIQDGGTVATPVVDMPVSSVIARTDYTDGTDQGVLKESFKPTPAPGQTAPAQFNQNGADMGVSQQTTRKPATQLFRFPELNLN